MKLLQMGQCTDLMDITYTEDNIKASVTIDLASWKLNVGKQHDFSLSYPIK